jgi:hypothetical protein
MSPLHKHRHTLPLLGATWRSPKVAAAPSRLMDQDGKGILPNQIHNASCTGSELGRSSAVQQGHCSKITVCPPRQLKMKIQIMQQLILIYHFKEIVRFKKTKCSGNCGQQLGSGLSSESQLLDSRLSESSGTGSPRSAVNHTPSSWDMRGPARLDRLRPGYWQPSEPSDILARMTPTNRDVLCSGASRRWTRSSSSDEAAATRLQCHIEPMIETLAGRSV